jgi:hypothetical protein
MVSGKKQSDGVKMNEIHDVVRLILSNVDLSDGSLATLQIFLSLNSQVQSIIRKL